MTDPADVGFYLLTLPGGVSATFIGLCRPDPEDARFVHLLSPAGVILFRVERRFVRKSSQAETAARLREDARHLAGIRGN